ncbi:NAD(P)/FAD-dependent oxidoreductase [Geodermatophilus sp. SYSU D00703]
MTPADDPAPTGARPRVVIVGGGFAGVGCARELADADVDVTLIDRNNYHQFQPLLYQVATAQLAPVDVGTPLRTMFRKQGNIDVKQAEVSEVDVDSRTVSTADGLRWTGDHLVLATGAQPNFYRTPGAAEHSLPLYSLPDAERLRSRILEAFDAADRDPRLIDRGALTFVVVGGGATGVEIAGALADFVNTVVPEEYHDLAVHQARIHLVDHGNTLLGPFSQQAHEYAAKVLQRDGVRLHLGTGVEEVTPAAVRLEGGTTLPTRCVIWAGGVQAADVAARCGLPRGRGGRLRVGHDLSVEGHPRVFVLGDVAAVESPDGSPYPQLGSVALQQGQWTAKNIRRDLAGQPRRAFHYHDKGIMAMIGRGAAVAEMGHKRHELHGSIAFASWLGVHAWLMSGVRSRVDAFVSWGWDYFSGNRSPGLIDHPSAATIDWSEAADVPAPRAPAPTTVPAG